MADEILVGNKPAMNYVLAVITQFQMGSQSVVVKARGKAISRAVDVAEITRRRFFQDAKISRIEIGTEELEREGDKFSVSTIEITIER